MCFIAPHIAAVPCCIFAKPGDYLYRTQEGFQFTYGGLWGIFRVRSRLSVEDTTCLSCDNPPQPTGP